MHTLTETQENNIFNTSRNFFEVESEFKTDDVRHFSLESIRLNFKTMRLECTFNVWSELGEFDLKIQLNDNKKPLKKTIKIEKI